MKIVISGASGYIGTNLSSALKNRGHEFIRLSRADLYGTTSVLAEKISGSDVVVNLAGAPVLKRWTKKAQTEIYESRVRVTKNLVDALKLLPPEKKPNKFISASAIGIYQPGLFHDETSSAFEEGFIGKVVRDWEKSSENLPGEIQRVVFRIGLVLGKEAKTIKNLLLPFKLGLGGTIGNGQQPFPFIHIEDVIKAFIWAIEEFNQSEVFNLVAPERTDNKTFTKKIAKKLNRPAFLFVPAFILKLVYGKAAEILSGSPSVCPAKIIRAGFSFGYPSIDSALDEIFN